MLEWNESFDDNDNSIWEAASPFIDRDGDSFVWRLKQRLYDNQIEWHAAHDAEVGGNGEVWASLEDAKHDIEASHEFVVKTAGR